MLTFGSTLPRLFLGAALLTLVACSGGGGGGAASTAPSANLVYTNDPSATTDDWRVEVDPATNGTAALMLQVFGPTGKAIQGATVFLTCAAGRTAWTRPAGATDPCALPGVALDLSQGPDASVQLFKSHRIGSDLQIAIYQKTGTAVLAADRPLFSVALASPAGTSPGAASLAATPGRTSIYLEGAVEQPLPLKVGTLQVQ
jgi:hypothetical protein